MAEESLESFEHGNFVALKLRSHVCEKYLSWQIIDSKLTLRTECDYQEHFRLCKWCDGTFSLQHTYGYGYLSPTTPNEGVNWISRENAPDGGWERLRLQCVAHNCDNLVSEVQIYLQQKDQKWYIGLNLEGNLVVTATSTTWLIQLVQVPLINVLGLHLSSSASDWSKLDARNCPLNDRRRGFILKLLRALREVGAFYIIGHGLSPDLFHTCQSVYGNQAYRDDADVGTDRTYKINERLFSTMEGFNHASITRLESTGLPGAALEDMIRMYVDDAEALSNGILHCMAAAQQFATGAAHVSYRGAWRDRHQYIGLRCLSYHPGPMNTSSGKVVTTTARHTDATWLTMLWNDNIPGLYIRPASEDILACPTIQGALLVNTGNVMKKASSNFFNAVCHWVSRNLTTEKMTRISMPFFYDRFDDSSDTAFWNGGTGGCLL